MHYKLLFVARIYLNFFLDPAMPLFVTADIDNKLDASDAEFVDVLHTNSLVQGKVERCGHVVSIFYEVQKFLLFNPLNTFFLKFQDFYLNGGIIQPGCNGFGINPFQCSQ